MTLSQLSTNSQKHSHVVDLYLTAEDEGAQPRSTKLPSHPKSVILKAYFKSLSFRRVCYPAKLTDTHIKIKMVDYSKGLQQQQEKLALLHSGRPHGHTLEESQAWLSWKNLPIAGVP